MVSGKIRRLLDHHIYRFFCTTSALISYQSRRDYRLAFKSKSPSKLLFLLDKRDNFNNFIELTSTKVNVRISAMKLE